MEHHAVAQLPNEIKEESAGAAAALDHDRFGIAGRMLTKRPLLLRLLLLLRLSGLLLLRRTPPNLWCGCHCQRRTPPNLWCGCHCQQLDRLNPRSLKVKLQLAPNGNREEFVGRRQRTQLSYAHTASLPLPPEKGHGHL
jgi:hypothetical protein